MLTLRGPNCARRGAALQELSIIPDGSLLIHDGRIHSVGTTRRIENLKEARGADEIDVSDKIVMPGFVDAGIHLSCGSEAPQRRPRLTSFYEESLSLMRSCLQHGTLNAQVKIGDENVDWRSDLSLIGQLAKVGDQPIGMIRSWRIGNRPHQNFLLPDDYQAAFSKLASRQLIHAIEVIAGSGAPVSDIWTAMARLKDFGVSLHWRGESHELLAGLLERVQPQSVSCRRNLTAGERAVLAQANVPVAVSIGESLTEDTAMGGVRQLTESGAAIALSSGYHPRETPVFNMQMIIALAVLRLRLTTEEAISAATINPAYALGLGDAIGSLEVGKRADVLVMNLQDYREMPRQFGVNHVGMAIREGKIIFNRTGRKVSAA